MKTSPLQLKSVEHESATPIHSPQLPGNFEELRKLAQQISNARGRKAGMTLDDWVDARRQLRQRLN